MKLKITYTILKLNTKSKKQHIYKYSLMVINWLNNFNL